MSYQELKAEVEDLQRRRGSLNRDERARLPWAIRDLRATPEQQAIEAEYRRDVDQFCRDAIASLDANKTG